MIQSSSYASITLHLVPFINRFEAIAAHAHVLARQQHDVAIIGEADDALGVGRLEAVQFLWAGKMIGEK